MTARLICPIFGNDAPPPAPSTEGLPPMMALASAELGRALREPTNLADQWPLADPPGLVAARISRQEAERKHGRKTDVKPSQVVRLVRFKKVGDSLRVAAAKSGLSTTTAHRILAGQHQVAHHSAVRASGVFLPALRVAPAVPDVFHKSRKAPSGADQAPGAGAVAKNDSDRPNAAFPETGFEPALTASESEVA